MRKRKRVSAYSRLPSTLGLAKLVPGRFRQKFKDLYLKFHEDVKIIDKPQGNFRTLMKRIRGKTSAFPHDWRGLHRAPRN
jgi:hypothetical protein